VTFAVLPSKLQVPTSPPKILDRSRLNERLREAFRRPVTLIAADAGFGKSTLVASFLASEDRPTIWFRLDPSDGDPAVFAAHLLHGLRSHVSRAAYQAARRGLGLASDWKAAAQLLSLASHRVRHDIVIVLDDLHLLTSPGLAEGMTRWIDALPSRVHLAMLTRVLPDFPLARWRTQDRLAEFGADDLRFTLPELRALLVDLHGLALSDASLHVVAAKTEGWPAGIVLAIHAAMTQGAATAAHTLGTLSGSSREIYDYLAQEAFSRQTPEVQRFMLATAAVTRFSLPLANVLLGTAGARNRQVLDHLERSHLFTVSLDRERRWYRYHHLFQEFLQRTAAEHDPSWAREIHLQAAAWWEGHGETSEALHHLVEAGEFPRAAALLGTVGLNMVPQGHIETLRRWLAAIPEDQWNLVPRLYLIRGLTEVTSGEAREAAGWLTVAGKRLREAGDREGEIYALRWLVNLAIWEGGADLLTPLIPRVSELADRLQGFPLAARAMVLELMARVAQIRGEMRQAERFFAEAVTTGQSSGDDWTYLGSVRYQAEFLWAVLGRFREAADLFDDLLRLTRRRVWWHEHAHLHVERAEVLQATGRDGEADHHLAEALFLQPNIPCRLLHADLAIAAARSAARRGATDKAEALLRELLGVGERATHYGAFRFDALIELTVVVAAADPAEARRLASDALRAADQHGPFRIARALLTFGIAMGSQEHCRKAAELFGRLDAPHWRTLALLHGAAYAPAAVKTDGVQEATRALRALPDDAWPFLFAQASPQILVPYGNDPAVGSRIAGFLQTTSLPMQPRIMVRCLGPFELVLDGHAIGPETWHRSAPKRLFQHLLLQERPVHREEIAEALWPDLEPRHAANQLRVALSQLRRVLEPERNARGPSSLILTSGSMVCLARERFDVDIDRFQRALARALSAQDAARQEALAEAVTLYAGDLLADHPFEEWVQPHRDRLGRQYLEALTRLAEAEEVAGNHQAAAARWQAVVTREPGAEHAYRGLIRSYLALGRMADALRTFESCRMALADLGVEPSPETMRLRTQIPDLEPEARG
jgi:LuxR family maltose regulon positive regulatory protein